MRKNKKDQLMDDRELFRKGWQLFIDALNEIAATRREVRRRIAEQRKLMADGVRKTAGFNL